MKRFSIIALAALLVVALAMPAAAFENIFGGYWRTRAYTNQNFSGEDQSEDQDLSQIDTRTRLYYTAKFSDDFKFVNKFEMDAVWGGAASGYGDIGADGKDVEVKNTYADFTLGGCWNFKVGVQGYRLARGFIFDDDFAAAAITYTMDNITVPFLYSKAFEGGQGFDANDSDVDYYVLAPSFTFGDIALNPYVVWISSDDPNAWIGTGRTNFDATDGEDGVFDELSIYLVGVDIDAKLAGANIWFTGIYEGGTVDFIDGTSTDISAWLAAIGGGYDFGFAAAHGQFFYATGDDASADDTDFEQFFIPEGQSYYWAEIMGLGIIDMQVSNNSPADQIGDIWAANLGADFKPMDDLKISLDLWYAALAEDITIANADGTTEDVNSLGFEIDLVAKYKLWDNLDLDLVGAYLFAGDATTLNNVNEADPWELGARLSLAF